MAAVDETSMTGLGNNNVVPLLPRTTMHLEFKNITCTINMFHMNKLRFVASDDEERSVKILIKSNIYEIGEGKAVFCKGKNVDPKEMQWVDNNGQVVEDGGKNVYRHVEPKADVLVMFITIQEQDEGLWICQTKDGMLKDTINLIVGSKVVLDAHETKRADENKNIKLSCKILKGSPPPMVLWYREENMTSPIESSPKGGPIKYVVSSKNDVHYLEIKKLSREDDGKYLCKAIQKKLNQFLMKEITLEVRYKPVFYNPEVRNQQDGQGSSTTVEEVFAVLNNTKNITCGAYAFPPAKFTWVKVNENKDVKLGTETIVEDDTSSTLILRMANETDTGEYKCTATNVLGSSIVIFHVTLGVGPKPPNHIEFIKEESNHTFMTFNVTCDDCKLDVEGNFTPTPDYLPVIGYSFQLVPYKPNYVADWDNAEEILTMIEDPQQTKFAVGPLANDTKYHARVRSVNQAGTSDWLEDPFVDEEHLPFTKFGVRLASSTTTVLLLASAFLLN